MENKTGTFELHRSAVVSWDILDSEAFQTLSAKGIRVLLRFLQKRKWTKARRTREIVYENSGLTFTYAEAKTLGISGSMFCRVIKKLIAIGFIDVEHQGGIHKNDFSIFSISERWKTYGTADFVEVKKPRVLWLNHDVRSWMGKKDAARSCSEPLHDSAAIEDIQDVRMSV